MKLQVYWVPDVPGLSPEGRQFPNWVGEFYVRLVADNGKLLMRSEGYKRKDAAMNMAKKVQGITHIHLNDINLPLDAWARILIEDFAVKNPLRERFMKKWTLEPDSGCWLWTGSRRRHGYGRMYSLDRKGLSAHRVSWELFRGPIPDGLDVLHKCDNPPCVNPDHLFVGTMQDNMDDMVRKGRQARGSRLGRQAKPGDCNNAG